LRPDRTAECEGAKPYLAIAAIERFGCVAADVENGRVVSMEHLRDSLSRRPGDR
jgi:hypothetical protein